MTYARNFTGNDLNYGVMPLLTITVIRIIRHSRRLGFQVEKRSAAMV